MVRKRSIEAEPAVPSPAPQADPTNVLFEVWLVARATTAMLDAALAPAGLTADEFAIYSVLAQGTTTPSALAQWMSAPLTTVSSYVKRFESRGHVSRVTSPADRRSFQLHLTDEGRDAHHKAGVYFQEQLRLAESALGSDREPVSRALKSLHAVITELPRP